MQLFLYVLGGLILIFIISQIVGKFTSIPCPARLAWIVNQDNPFFKNYRTASILNSLALQEGMQVLDFGCGAGRLTIPIAKAVGMLGKVTAADIQTAMLAIVQAKAEKEQLENIEYLHTAAGEGKLGINIYDRALLVTVLGEVPNKLALLREIYDSLKPHGWLCITEVIADPDFQFRKWVRNLAEKAGFIERASYGNSLSYTLVFEKPELLA